MNTPLSPLQHQAILLLRQSILSQDDQLTIEAAITELSLQRRCTRQRAAQLLHQLAFPS
ncbi:hypothetical protein H6F89_25445 [Cyanobacteria bacterium FACHB-63]|nr:hypothetical protein [Cyanobacteria bacterium FACHB-63]